MFKVLQTLTPDQITLLVGALVSVIHSGLVKTALFRVKSFSDAHRTQINWFTSFALPLLASVALFLHNNQSFNHAFPVYAEVYASAQLFYITVGKATKTVRSWYEAYVVLNAQAVAPEASF
jgi:hypothetical protein